VDRDRHGSQTIFGFYRGHVPPEMWAIAPPASITLKVSGYERSAMERNAPDMPARTKVKAEYRIASHSQERKSHISLYKNALM